MNKLYVGVDRVVVPPRGGYLLIDEEGEGFDPRVHSFNPLKSIDYKRARDFAEIIFTGAGKETLTVRNGKRALTRLLLSNTRLDRIKAESKDPAVVEAVAAVDDLLLSPVLRKVLCNPTNFSFKGKVSARINRAELGDFDSFILGALLIGHYQGQVVVPDFGFYGRDFHTNLIRQNRLIAGVNCLSELPEKLRQNVLLIKDKEGCGCTFEDAEALALYARLRPDTVGFNEFVDKMM